MVRSLRRTCVAAIIAAGFAFSGALATRVSSAEPAAAAGQAPTADAKLRARVEARVWWNDPEIVQKLSLTAEQRASMDRLLSDSNLSLSVHSTRAARAAYLRALASADYGRARKELAAWADTERKQIQAEGEYRIGVLSLLSRPQRKALDAALPHIVRIPWTARPSWGSGLSPSGSKEKVPAPGTAPHPAEKPRAEQ